MNTVLAGLGACLLVLGMCMTAVDCTDKKTARASIFWPLVAGTGAAWMVVGIIGLTS